MPTGSICDYCGKDCGNAGAATNHETACEANPANRGDAPARAQRAEAVPATPSEQPSTTGGALADGLITAADENASVGERVGAIQALVGVVGDGIERYNQYRERQMEEGKDRAARVELEPIPDYPECVECSAQLGPEDIGTNNEEIKCPSCGKHYRVIDPEEPAGTVDA